jgi:hypothetical protein
LANIHLFFGTISLHLLFEQSLNMPTNDELKRQYADKDTVQRIGAGRMRTDEGEYKVGNFLSMPATLLPALRQCDIFNCERSSPRNTHNTKLGCVLVVH